MAEKHYLGKGNVQVFDFIEAFSLGFNLGNVAKYICRCGRKGSDADAIKDLRKAIVYLEREIDTRQKAIEESEQPKTTSEFRCRFE